MPNLFSQPTEALFVNVGTEERRWTANMKPLYQKSLTTSSLPLWWWSKLCFSKCCVYIFDCCKFKIIGNNGPFPLLIYCALPIASLDLIECIYCLNDLFFIKYYIMFLCIYWQSSFPWISCIKLLSKRGSHMPRSDVVQQIILIVEAFTGKKTSFLLWVWRHDH